MKINLPVIEKINKTQDVMSIRVKKSHIIFKAGQFFKLYSNSEFRYLSVSCSPQRDYLEFTKKITESAFSAWFKSLEVECQVAIEGPYGNFIIEDKEDKICFIAGGIGITPVFSMIDDAFLTSSKKDFVLFYGNRSCNDIVFYSELNYYSQSMKLRLFIFIEDKNENFYQGVVNSEKILKLLPDVRERIAFVCGPPQMVDTITKQIKNLNLTKKLKTEKLIGY